MIKLKSILGEAYVGDCRTIIDRDILFSDATEMAQIIENSIKISYQDFCKVADLSGTPRLLKLYLRKNPDRFLFGKCENIKWVYDTNTDIHYFFV